jgi:hypothetical protein
MWTMDTKDNRTAVLEKRRRITAHRPIKIQVCLSEDERVRLSTLARAAGHEAISAYVRARTLGPAGQ